ncbi:MAG TPA: MFS transporter [Propylenella sp.]|nr:MFS transporter [Propylenella sp.]
MASYRTIALTVSTAIFMQYLDATALTTALPAMARDLDVPAVSLNVAILAYQLSLAAFIPIGNIAADRMGPRNAFAGALSVFLIGSVLCAMSQSLPALVAARAFQGLGGAVMMPVARQIVVRSAAKHELVSAMSWLLIPGTVGPLLGPLVGGLIVTYASWQWIFLVNLPVGLIGIALTFALVPDSGVRISKRIDVPGVLLIAATITCLIFGLEGLARPGAGLTAAGLLVSAVLLGTVYVRHAIGNASAPLDLSLLRIGSFRHSMIAGTLLRIIASGTGFVFPLWFQLSMGMNAAEAGILIVAIALGALISRVLTTHLVRRAHPHSVAVCGAAVVVLVLLAASMLLQPELPKAWFFALLCAQGIAINVALVIISAVAYVDVPSERTGAATGLYTTLQQFTLSLGVTAGVWAIAVMGWFGHGDTDHATYSGSVVMLAVVAALGVYATGTISRGSLGALRKQDGTN